MLGAEFRARRLEIGWTQKQIAALMRVNSVTVARWETGVYPVPEGLALLAFEVIALRRMRNAVATQERRLRTSADR